MERKGDGMNIGQRLKTLRQIKGLTQEELAERTDLSKGYISQIESGYASPSMDTFLSILEVMNTNPSTFFKKQSETRVLYKSDLQHRYDEYDEGYVLNWLVSQSHDFEMDPLKITLRPHASYKAFAPSNSETFVYCLKGQIQLQLGASEYIAETGDALYFKANQSHCLSNPSEVKTEVMVVTTSTS